MAFEDWFVARARISSKMHKKVSLDDKMAFFQQLSTLISSGTPLLQAIKISAEQTQSRRMRAALEDIAARISAGSSLHAAAALHTKVFEQHWVEVLRTGEVTGQMATVLIDLNRQIRESRDTRRKVIGSLIYPVILIIFAIGAVSVMLAFVVPTFAGMFKDMGAELPGITQFVVDSSTFIVKYGLYILAGAVAACFAVRHYVNTEGGRRRVIGVAVALPMVGPLVIESAMYRFASNISLMLKSGVPMIETLQTVSGVFHGNPIFRDAILRAQNRVAAGRPLAASLEETGLFTSMMTNMVRIGEASGELANVMAQIAPYYREKVEATIGRVTKLMEPFIIVGMGGTIAGLMMSIYLPMFEMAGKVH